MIRACTDQSRLQHRVRDIIQIVQFQTYRRWLRKLDAGEELKKPGRPKTIIREIRNLVIRVAIENVKWGYHRVHGELKKLMVRISFMSVRRICREEGIFPPPDDERRLRQDTNWMKFVRAHMATLIACDFFTKPVLTWRGKVDAYCLFFIHYKTRKVFCSPATFSPDEDWVMQQTRNAVMYFEYLGIFPRFLIHDHDSKFTVKFDMFFEDLFTGYHPEKDTKVILSIIQAPNMNCYAEAFVKSIKRENLNHFLCFGLDHLDYLTQTWVEHYNHHRPHQGIGNEPLDDTIVRPETGTVVRRQILGGLVNEYYRVAA